jgi:urease accessory protein
MNSRLALIRLLQLASPALPVGAYTYSQGLELAVAEGIVHDESSARLWIGGILRGPMESYEAPVVAALHTAWQHHDVDRITALNDEFLASRETSEFRAETVQMGYSMKRLAAGLPDTDLPAILQDMDETAFPTVWSVLAAAWAIPRTDAVTAYLWSWCENQTLAAVKTVPLGQTAGQRILVGLGTAITESASRAVDLPESDWSGFSPGLAIAGCRHETLYSRLFRS